LAISDGNGKRGSEEQAKEGDGGDLNHDNNLRRLFVVKSVVEIERFAVNAVRGTVNV
jgi:hypothetical protein